MPPPEAAVTTPMANSGRLVRAAPGVRSADCAAMSASRVMWSVCGSSRPGRWAGRVEPGDFAGEPGRVAFAVEPADRPMPGIAS